MIIMMVLSIFQWCQHLRAYPLAPSRPFKLRMCSSPLPAEEAASSNLSANGTEIWRFPEMGVPSHPFWIVIFHEININKPLVRDIWAPPMTMETLSLMWGRQLGPDQARPGLRRVPTSLKRQKGSVPRRSRGHPCMGSLNTWKITGTNRISR